MFSFFRSLHPFQKIFIIKQQGNAFLKQMNQNISLTNIFENTCTFLSFLRFLGSSLVDLLPSEKSYVSLLDMRPWGFLRYLEISLADWDLSAEE
jgi:hypothetical protein